MTSFFETVCLAANLSAAWSSSGARRSCHLVVAWLLTSVILKYTYIRCNEKVCSVSRSTQPGERRPSGRNCPRGPGDGDGMLEGVLKIVDGLVLGQERPVATSTTGVIKVSNGGITFKEGRGPVDLGRTRQEAPQARQGRRSHREYRAARAVRGTCTRLSSTAGPSATPRCATSASTMLTTCSRSRSATRRAAREPHRQVSGVPAPSDRPEPAPGQVAPAQKRVEGEELLVP